jgi:hypothetical protein
VALTFHQEVTVQYANGETPVLGDYVKNDLEQPGTVARLRMASSGFDFVSIRWTVVALTHRGHQRRISPDS